MVAVVAAMVLLNPARLFYQPQQPVPVELTEPGAYTLVLLSPEGAKRAQGEVEVKEEGGTFDLAEALPAVWDGKTHYVQAVDAAGEAKGSPLVVVPIWPPNPQVRAQVRRERDGLPWGLRVYAERRAVLNTSEGKIVIGFSPQHAPNTVRNFMHLVDGGMYTNVPFHRILPEFVIQGGDPTGTGRGGPGYMIDLEKSSKKHDAGVLSMARSRDEDSAGSQFFICLTREKAQHLDGAYAAFGDVVEGMDVVQKIAATPLADARAGTPVKPPVIESCQLIPAPPRTVPE